jgi:isochorismate pyruvate lyase
MRRREMNSSAVRDPLEEIRANIDALDQKIVALIGDRGALVSQAGRFKRTVDEVRAPSRVEQVVWKVRAEAVKCGADAEVVEATYRAMINAFIQMETREHAAPGGVRELEDSASEGSAESKRSNGGNE